MIGLGIYAVIGLAGLVFLLQGLGYLPGSVMTGDPLWAYIGGAMLIGAIALATRSFLSRPR